MAKKEKALTKRVGEMEKRQECVEKEHVWAETVNWWVAVDHPLESVARVENLTDAGDSREDFEFWNCDEPCKQIKVTITVEEVDG